MVTGAANKGRQDSYARAAADSIILQKEWIATKIAGLGGLVVAVKAVTFAVGTLIPAWKALSAAFTASPLGVVTVGIVAVVAAVAPLIDSLTKVNRMAEKFSENALDAADALKEIEAEASNTVAETYAATDAADKYLDRLDELEQKTELTADEQAEYASIVEKLRATLPDVTIEIDEQTGKLKESTDAIREQTKARQELATKFRYMDDNVTVLEIPYHEVSNADGITVIIGGVTNNE